MSRRHEADRGHDDERDATQKHEAERVEALCRYDVLGAPAKQSLDRLTRLAGALFETDVAAVSLVGARRQWTASCWGLDLGATDRERSFCHYALQSDEPTVVEDARQDARFADAPFVTDAPHLRFYAGAPLVTPGGHTLGTFCVMDTRARPEFGERQRRLLTDFADAAMDELELRREAITRRESHARETAEKKFSDALIEGLPGIFYLFDEQGRIKRWNDRFEATVGYEPEEIRALDPLDLVAEKESVAAKIREGFATGTAGTELHLVAKDGSETSYHCFVRRIEIEGRAHLVGMGVDITERRRTEARLREREERFRNLVERASDVITIATPDGTVRYQSPSLKNVLGTPPEVHAGGSLFAGIHEADLRRVRRAFERAVTTPGKVVTAQFRAQHAHGYWVHLESKVQAQLEGSVIDGVIINTRDVSKNLRYEAEREARKRAEELLRAKTALMNTISHELRTPLASILGFAEVLEEEGTELHQEFAGRIAESGVRLRKTLDSVLELARLESEGAKIERTRVDVAAVAREATELFRGAATQEGLAMGIEAPEEAVALLDERALYRILHNLLSNAVKFTHEGRVTVRVEKEPESAAGDGSIHLIVQDTGIGIDEAFREQLFEEFEQESRGLNRSYEGVGLGLAITKRLVDMMEGSISVESTKGEGAAFTVSFPSLSGDRQGANA